MYRSSHYSQSITGLSLIELIVALAVSAIMLLGVTTVYTASKRSYQINTEMAKIQENARFALHRLTKEIRMAGHTGCMNIDKLKLNVLSNPDSQPPGFKEVDPGNPNASFGVNTYVTGHTDDAGVYTPAFEVGLSPIGNIEPGTDAITIRGVSACSSAVIGEDADLTTLTVQGNCNFKKDDVVIVTNCRAADMFTITEDVKGGVLKHDDTKNSQAETTQSYLQHASVFKANAVVFYIGQDTNDPPNIGLYAMRLVNQDDTYKGVTSLLIPNVENMAITYGLDIDGDVSRGIDSGSSDVSAKNVGGIDISEALANEDRANQDIADTAWSRVVRINMQLLLASDPVGTVIKPAITFNGKEYKDDTRSRRVFSTAINIRARTP